MEKIRERFHPLYQHYITDFSQIKDFYQYHPLSFQERWDDVVSSYSFNRSILVDSLKHLNLSLGAGPATLASIEKLRNPETMAVVGGQQAGLLTGPLYSIYKVISLLKLTRALTEKGFSVVPIFWVASEDHDLKEINQLHFLNKSNHLKSLSLEGEPTGASVSAIPLHGKEAQLLLLSLKEETPQTEFKERVMDLLYKTLEESSTLVQWFMRLILSLFPSEGLILFDPMKEDILHQTPPFWEELFSRSDQMIEALKTKERRLEERGFPVQVQREEHQLPFFLEISGCRQALFLEQDRFTNRDKSISFTSSQLLACIQKRPSKVTSNALTRPILQGFLLPVLVYVGGPSELAYHAQLKEAFLVMGQKMPLLFPRPGMTIVEGRIASHMKEYGLHFSKVLGDLDEMLEEKIKRSSPIDIEGLFLDVRKRWKRDYQELLFELKKIHEDLFRLGEKNKERILGEMAYLEEKAYQFHRRNEKVLRGHFQRMKESLYPKEDLQERVLNLFPFLIKYGFSFLKALDERLNLEEEHVIFYYEGDSDG